MKKVLNFGSVNIDHVYQVNHFVRPGETLASQSYQIFAGGKGYNQSVALARAGAPVWHAGKIGRDGLWLRDQLQACGAATDFLDVTEAPTGHAIIQVNEQGENAIILHGGANQTIQSNDIDRVLAAFSPGDYLLVQNEISAVPDLIATAADRGLQVVFNPAPLTPSIRSYPLDRVSLFILNEIEAEGLTSQTEPEQAVAVLRQTFPGAEVLLTLGSQGALYARNQELHRQPAPLVAAVDTTGAGDTFIGFFLATLLRQAQIQEALRIACRAAALCVTRAGAADSIPTLAELEAPQSNETKSR